MSKPAGAVDTMGNRGSKKSKDNIEDIMVCTVYVVHQRYTYMYFNGIQPYTYMYYNGIQPYTYTYYNGIQPYTFTYYNGIRF